jgi:endoglucanase Acf2
VLAQYAGDLVIGAGASEFREALIEGFSDWAVSLRFEAQAGSMSTTLAHGSPFVFVRTERLRPQLLVARNPHIWHRTASFVGFSIGSHVYGAFAPDGAAWTYADSAFCLAEGADRFSLAALPEETAAALALFAEVADSRLSDTRVEWHYDEGAALIRASYRVEPGETLLALYPHQWRALVDESQLTGYAYETVRGRMKVLRGSGFETTLGFPGALPVMPALGNETERLRELVAEVATEGDHHLAALWPHAERDMYWTGVSLNRISTLVPIAERVGAEDVAAELVSWLKGTLEDHFSGRSGAGVAKTEQTYWYDELWTTMIGFPGGFGANTALNDHHYQYGYWIRAAAEIARHDPTWTAPARWGGMVDLLVRDIATTGRDDRAFPFIRHFDLYAGHSWATGRQEFPDGPNAESSSEAIAAWAAVMLWGELTGNRELRDLGAFLYATEISAAEEYWFDVRNENLPSEYGLAMVGQVWGGKSSYSTWWTDDPEAIRGISLIPLTPTSLYLGRNPEYVLSNLNDLRRLRNTWSYWPDVFWAYEALVDPEHALELCNAADPGYQEGHSESKPHTLSWILDLLTLGRIDAEVKADTPLFAVFRRGSERTHIAFNAGAEPCTITFSDGVTFEVEPGTAKAVASTHPPEAVPSEFDC